MRSQPEGRRAMLVTIAVAMSILVGACAAPSTPSPAPTAKPAAQPTAAKPAATEKSPSSSPAAEKPAADKPAAKPAPKAAKISIPVESVSSSYWPLYVMEDKGFAKDENIDFELIIMDSSKIQAALIGKSVEIIDSGTEGTVRAVESGEDQVFVGATMIQVLYSLVVAPGIKSAEQLKGKKVGSNSLVGGNTILLRRTLRYLGLKDSDYDLVSAGGSNGRLAALKAGGIQAAFLERPVDLLAIQDGFEVLTFVPDIIKDWPQSVLTIRRDWPKSSAENEDVLVRFLRALAKSCQWINDPKNKQEAVKMMATRLKMDEESVAQTYDLYIKYGAPPKQGEISMDGMKTALDVINEMGDVFKGPIPPPEKYVDLSYLDKAVGRR